MLATVEASIHPDSSVAEKSEPPQTSFQEHIAFALQALEEKDLALASYQLKSALELRDAANAELIPKIDLAILILEGSPEVLVSIIDQVIDKITNQQEALQLLLQMKKVITSPAIAAGYLLADIQTTENPV